MEGRWTIWVNSDGERLDDWLDAIDPSAGTEVPVVPCDEAAVQRVMSELGNWPDGSNLRDMAEAVFRAAGGE